SWPNLIYRKKRVVAIRTWISRMGGRLTWRDQFKMRWVNKALAIIAVSQAIKASIGDKAIVIGNPYRAELFNSYNSGSEKDKDFVFLGILVSDKGCDMAIDLVGKLNQNLQSNKTPYTLTVIGEGPENVVLKES